MPIESKEDFISKLERLDEETLLFLSKYAEQRQRASGVIAVVTGVIGSIAGAGLVVSRIWPTLTVEYMATIAALIGGITAIVSIFARRRSDQRLIETILQQVERNSADKDGESKRALIERLLKAEGLQ